MDARFSPAFESIEVELAKERSLHDDNEVDWESIRDQCEIFLATHSKDLRVAIWLTWSLHKRESFAGLLAGCTLVHQLCKTYWSSLHPLKPRTRTAAFNWLMPRLEKTLSEHVAIADQLPLFRQLAVLLRDLEDVLSKNLGAEAPLLLPLSRRLDDLVTRSAEGLPAPGSVGAALAHVKQVATQVFVPSTSIENEREANKSLRDLQDQVRPLCGYWLRQKTSDIRALRLARTLMWLPIHGLPEHNAERITSRPTQFVEQQDDHAQVEALHMRIPTLAALPAPDAVPDSAPPSTFWQHFGASLGIDLSQMPAAQREQLAVNAAQLLRTCTLELRQCLHTCAQLKREMLGESSEALNRGHIDAIAIDQLLAFPEDSKAQITQAGRTLQRHQVAAMAASRVALRSTLEQLSPAQATLHFERSGHRRWFTSDNHWGSYRHLHQTLEESLRVQPLGAHFARAYAEQQGLLSTLDTLPCGEP